MATAPAINNNESGKDLHLMHVRKTLVFVDEGRSEAMQTADIPLRKVAAVAVVKNPLVGCYHDDLSELVAASPSIGELVAGLALAALRSEEHKSELQSLMRNSS